MPKRGYTLCFGAKDPEVIQQPSVNFMPKPTFEQRAAKINQAQAAEVTGPATTGGDTATTLGKSLGPTTGKVPAPKMGGM